MAPKKWKTAQPISLRDSVERCLKNGKFQHNLSVQRLADLMGVSSHYSIYKWVESGRLPASLIIPFERACDANFVTTYLIHATGKMAVDIPVGNWSEIHEFNRLQVIFADALGLLVRYYDEQSIGAEEAQSALMEVMESLAWHRENLAKSKAPELDFESENPR